MDPQLGTYRSPGLTLPVLFAAQLASAQTSAPATPPPAPGSTRLDPVVVHGRDDSLVNIAETASQGTVGAEQLEDRPIFRPGEILETVPGLIVTQHSGEGKANQFFLRGFNLDHGTDFASSIDGVPINLPSHGHGQGYTDLNFLIPELVQRVDYRKGPYYAEQGDFSSAGAANMEYFRTLPHKIARFEGGMFDYYRVLGAGSQAIGPGDALAALELLHDNGPWEQPNHFKKINGVLRYSLGDGASGATLTASAYAGKWDATDQIAERALEDPGFGRFDSLDDSDGGNSQKYMLYGEWHRSDEGSATRAVVYGFHQDLDLFSNFTYQLDSPQGDQFKQFDRRWVGGGTARQTWFADLLGWQMENSVGLQLRSDSIENGLQQTVDGHVTDKVDWDGNPIPGTTRKDDIWELSLAPYLENRIQWCEKLRSVAGARLDYYHFDVAAFDPVDSGKDDAVRVSPKGSLVLGPWNETELYLSGGMGFHSNDARGVTAPVEPGGRAGADLRRRDRRAQRLPEGPEHHNRVLVARHRFGAPVRRRRGQHRGPAAPQPPLRRRDRELLQPHRVAPGSTPTTSISHARFRDSDPAGDHIPGSIERGRGGGDGPRSARLHRRASAALPRDRGRWSRTTACARTT